MDLNLDSFIKDKTLVFTVTSDGYKYFTWNLALVCARLKVPWKLCILCLDRESYDFFQRVAFLPAKLYLMDGRVEHKSPALFSTPLFKKLNRMKLKALEALSQRSDIDTLLYLDSDIVLFKDPLLGIHEYLRDEHPLWFQCDEKQEGRFDCSDTVHCPNPCSGVIAMRLTEITRPQFKQIFGYDNQLWNNIVGDQDYIQARMKQFGIPYKTLPREAYPNGIFLADNRYKGEQLVLLHFNYFVGNDKKRVMKNKDCWLLNV